MNLRDHDQKCEHSRHLSHGFWLDGSFDGTWIECPGGAEVVIDYEAAGKRLMNVDIAVMMLGPTLTARHVVHAALGIDEEVAVLPEEDTQ